MKILIHPFSTVICRWLVLGGILHLGPAVVVYAATVTPPSITQQPLPVQVAKFLPAFFFVSASGSPTLLYQWYKDGQMISSATASSYAIPQVTSEDSGTYSVRVTNDGGSVTSTSVDLTMLPETLPRLASLDGAGGLGISPSYPFLLITGAIVTGSTPLTFQWFKDGVAIAGANSSFYSKPTATAADAGIYTLQISNAFGLVTSPDVIVTWTDDTTSAPWTDAVQLGDVVYFLASAPGRIMRYDLVQESWLPIIYLPEAKVPTAFLPTAEGVFIAYSNDLVRRSLDLQTEVAIVSSSTAIQELFSVGQLIYFQEGLTTRSWDRSTLVAGPNSLLEPYGLFSFTGTGRPVYSAGLHTLFYGSSTIAEYPVGADGVITFGGLSPTLGVFPTGFRQYLSPDESLLLDNSGVIYAAGTLDYTNCLGPSFDDLVFLANGTPVALRGKILSAYGVPGFVEIGRYLLSSPGYSIFSKNNALFVFGAPSPDATNPVVTKIASSAFAADSGGTRSSPIGKLFSIDDVFIDSNLVINLLSRSERGIVRWDTKTRVFLPTTPLRGSPLLSSYAPASDRFALAYNDGTLSNVFSAVDSGEQIFGHIPRNTPVSLVAMDDLMFVNMHRFGGDIVQGDDVSPRIDMVIGSMGELKDLSTVAYFPSTAYGLAAQAWESVNRRLYLLSDGSYSGMEYATVPGTGVLPDAPTASVTNIIPPLRFSSDESLALSGNQLVVNADLQLVGTLGNSVTDGTWLSDGLYTIRIQSTGTELQKWARTTYTKTGSLSLDGIPLRIFKVDDKSVAVVTLVKGYVAFYLVSSDLSLTSSAVNVPSLEASGKALGDFDGDGKADLVWTNTQTGERSMWFLNGNTTSGGATLGTVPTAWVVSATADFDGDGKADILWTNTVTGDRALWLMDGSTMRSNTFMGTVPVEWVISGTGDFNGDGKADLVWTNTTTGDRAMWLMNGSTVTGGGYLGTVPVAWVISGVGDFNGDGKADLVWSNTVTGERSMWFQNGSTTISGATLNTVPIAWVISGVGDFNGDGKADIFLTNTVSGDRVIWLMNGSTIATNAFMGTVPVEWTISGVGDFNGDKKKDLFWTNTATGDRAMWLLNGSTVLGGGYMGTVPVVWKIND